MTFTPGGKCVASTHLTLDYVGTDTWAARGIWGWPVQLQRWLILLILRDFLTTFDAHVCLVFVLCFTFSALPHKICVVSLSQLGLAMRFCRFSLALVLLFVTDGWSKTLSTRGSVSPKCMLWKTFFVEPSKHHQISPFEGIHRDFEFGFIVGPAS